MTNLQDFFPLDARLLDAAQEAERTCREDFAQIEETAAYNGAKVLAAFRKAG